MDYSSLLNERQLEAVTTASQYVRIVAGAGSGKTRVLTYRISYLIEEMHVDPRRILAIAFTNKVAEEMRARACALLHEQSSFVRVQTFHSFCSYFLRQEAEKIGYPSSYTIFDEDDQAALVKDVAVTFGYKKSDKIVKEALEFIRKNKGMGLYPPDVSLKHRDETSTECLRFYKKYEEKKASMYALDFDDLILQTINILDNCPDVQEYWSHRFDHLLVDEFQDVNDIQYKLILLLSRPDSCVYVVGDPDQTIYTWRGANQGIIMGFNKDHPSAETIILDQNYRSTKNILACANKLIAYNRNRVPKDLYTLSDEGAKVVTRKAYNPNGEAEYVAREVINIAKKNSADGKPDYRNIAILYRSSYLTRPFESEFGGRGIPYRIFGGQRFYQRMEVKDVLAYMRLIQNPLDDVSFERIANTPRRSFGESALERFKVEATAAGMSDYEYAKKMEKDQTEIPPRAFNSVKALIEKIEAVKGKLRDNVEVFSQVIKDFITDIGYFDFLVENQEPDEDRVANVNSLFDDMTSFISRHDNCTIEEYLQNITLLTSQDDIKDGNYVTFMTVHIAKGLEFDNVFVVGLTSVAFPNVRSITESGMKGMEEERRLAYVAMTRARKVLYLTCNVGYSYVSDSTVSPSPFFNEAGLPFPAEDERIREPAYFGGRNTNSSSGGWHKPTSRGDIAFFSDGDHLTPFEEKKEEDDAPKTNGIYDWQVGDKVHHKTFGDGVVTGIVGARIIVVQFETVGAKTLVSDHPFITRVASKGGQA